MATSQPSIPALRNEQASSTYLTTRSLILSLAKLLMVGIAQVPFARAYPFTLWTPSLSVAKEEAPPPSGDPTIWIYLLVAVGLVLLGGAFAGLTIALMGQDEIYLQVIKTSGEPYEQRHAGKVLTLLKKGKHWVLVTLLLGNVITNETLPIVLDRSLGGGWPAVLGSTVMIVIFGEIIPQSICVRYGLPIGAWMSPLVLVLMYVLAPVAWPTAKLLDYLLGEDHGTTYKKAGLKTLVTLHKSLGAAGEQLNQDEVTIISAVLDLKAKPVGNIMTPMEDVFTMSADTVLNEATMEVILGAGYSRIPIHAPDNESNFVGMLLVKILITYDPEDCKRVRDFALATLPETRAETSCLDIVNFFQEGKSHMVLVSEYPGEDHGALGVVTLEDVIEELIGEEIIDESDVFIDVHKAIRRLNPAPKSRVPKGEVVTEPDSTIAEGEESLIDVEQDAKDEFGPAMKHNATPDGFVPRVNGDLATSPGTKQSNRRTSSIANVSDRESSSRPRQMNPEMREHLKHLGPSNLASRPRTTRYNTVKIKPGAGSLAEGLKDVSSETPRAGSIAAQGGVGAGLVTSAGKNAKDGVLALQAGYGTIPSGSPSSPKKSRKGSLVARASEETRQARLGADGHGRRGSKDHSRTNSHSTLGSVDGILSPRSPNNRGTARSGSITENIIEAGGIKKTVLEMTSSSESPDEAAARNGKENDNSGNGRRKKRRRRKRKPGERDGEGTPLLGATGGGRAERS